MAGDHIQVKVETFSCTLLDTAPLLKYFFKLKLSWCAGGIRRVSLGAFVDVVIEGNVMYHEAVC